MESRRGRAGGFNYKPARQQAAESLVASAWLEAGSPRIVGEKVPITISLEAFLKRPKGHFKQDGELSAAGRRNPFPLRKPDLSNVMKHVEDVLTKVNAWGDDSWVVDATLTKRFSDDEACPGGVPCLVVMARSIGRSQT